MKQTDPSPRTVPFVCPKTGRVIGPKPMTRLARWLLLIAGLASLAWFCARVIPKPSRAMYPCQRMAFPVASGFVVWLVGLVASVVAFGKMRRFGRQHRAVLAGACAVVAIGAGLHTLVNAPARPSLGATTVPQTANTPVGAAKGICPGRVVWVHDAKATDYLGWSTGDGYWWETRHNNQAAVDNMVSLAIRTVVGTSSDEGAWAGIFRHYNSTHGRGDVGYAAGEKINIKANLVASCNWNDGRVNLTTYVQSAYAENVSVSPYMILSLLRQLVYKAGVPQENISVGDSTCFFVSQYWDTCHSEFPNVQYLDNVGLCGRVKVNASTHKFWWSKPGVNPAKQDYVPQPNVDATYFINFGNLKAHQGGGVTLCGKNYYGALIRKPGDSGYYELHYDLPYTAATASMGRYRTLTDFMAHGDFGGKGLLWMIDGLWGGDDAGTRPTKWSIAPFNGDWPSSLLVSQDPVAIDSVGVDACKAQWTNWYPNTVVATDDYLHEAALINDPPSGTFYDPDHSGLRRASLGVHEHWNNNTSRQYSRNLGTGSGIELLWFDVGDPGDVNRDKSVTITDLLAVVNTFGQARGQVNFDQKTDLNYSGRIDIGDLLQVVNNYNKTYP